MRDPNRIYPFCMKIAEMWSSQCPDWRFCQLVSNVFGEDSFYIEDDKALLELERYFNIKDGEPNGNS